MRRAAWGVVLALAVTSVGLRAAIETGREPAEVPSAGRSFPWVLLPAGLRAIAVEVLWLRAEGYLDQGRFEELLSDYQLLAYLQSDDEVAVGYLADQLAFTVSRYTTDPEEELRWVRAAIRLLETGLRRNPASSILSAQSGEIYLDLLTRDTRIQTAFREQEGQSAAESALRAFARARDLEPGTARWSPKVVLCLFLAKRERLLAGEYGVARDYLGRASDLLREARAEEPDLFSDAGAGRRWLGRTEAWIEVVDELVRLEISRREGSSSRLERQWQSILDRLDLMVERFPEDRFAVEFRGKLRGD